MRMILLGPPGAGKGTQAKQLAQRLNLIHISTGDLLRQNVSEGTLLGKEAKGFMDAGALVPDELVTRMLAQRLKGADIKKGFILDGYPRNINQAETLDKMLEAKDMDIDTFAPPKPHPSGCGKVAPLSINPQGNLGIQPEVIRRIDFVVYLDTSDTVIIQRLSGRLVCRSCGLNFHIKNMPPRVDNICDHCGGSLYHRDDDNVETIKKRIAVYKKEVSTLIAYYQKKQKLYSLTADSEAGIVLDQICALAKKFNDSVEV